MLKLIEKKNVMHLCFFCIPYLSFGTSVEVLISFYGMFFVEVGQFINSKSLHIVPPHRPPFFRLLTPPRFGALNSESESSGRQPVLPETVCAWSS